MTELLRWGARLAWCLVIASVAGCDLEEDPCDRSEQSCDAEWAQWKMPANAGLYTTTDETVTDTVSGLMWQRHPREAMYTWERAAQYCEALAVEGHDDWRLPRRIELLSIVDYGRHDPAIDLEAFPETPTADFWTASVDPETYGGLGQVWAVSFYDGSPERRERDLLFPRARCVRGPDQPRSESSASGRFVAGNGTVFDPRTELTWQRDQSGDIPFQETEAYCQAMNEEGSTGWRVPSIKELLTLLTPGESGVWHIDKDAFTSDDPSAWTMWSSTSYSPTAELGAAWAWKADFWIGEASPQKTDHQYTSVRCVK